MISKLLFIGVYLFTFFAHGVISGGHSIEWNQLHKKATRFPFFEYEPDPLSGKYSRACYAEYNEGGANVYFIAVADTSDSKILWPKGLKQCQCKDASDSCIPDCPQDFCGTKILIRCRNTEATCLKKYRGKPIVVMVRDICPKKHIQNQKNGHCQGGNQIDLYKGLYRLMTGAVSGKNLDLDFAPVDQSVPLGPPSF